MQITGVFASRVNSSLLTTMAVVKAICDSCQSAVERYTDSPVQPKVLAKVVPAKVVSLRRKGERKEPRPRSNGLQPNNEKNIGEKMQHMLQAAKAYNRTCGRTVQVHANLVAPLGSLKA